MAEKLFVQIGIAAAMLLAFVLIQLLSGWKGVADQGGSRALLRYNPPMRIAGVSLLVLGGVCFPIFIIVLLIVVPPKEGWEYFAVEGFALAEALGGY